MDSFKGRFMRGMDAVELTAITVEYMLRENYSGDDILNFLTQESKYYKRDVDKNFTGIYGLFNGEYLDGTGWQPEKDYVPQDREWQSIAGKFRHEWASRRKNRMKYTGGHYFMIWEK